jgi:hypothetical protein
MRPQTFNDWCSAVAATAAIAALVISGLAWLFPQTPEPLKMLPDRIYEYDEPIGIVSDSKLTPLQPNQYMLSILARSRLTVGQIVGFRNTHCLFVELPNETLIAGQYAYEPAYCRIIGQ